VIHDLCRQYPFEIPFRFSRTKLLLLIEMRSREQRPIQKRAVISEGNSCSAGAKDYDCGEDGHVGAEYRNVQKKK